jgi:hypothetical protein
VRPSLDPGLAVVAPLSPRFVQPKSFSPPPTSQVRSLLVRIAVGTAVGLAVGLPLLFYLSRR